MIGSTLFVKIAKAFDRQSAFLRHTVCFRMKMLGSLNDNESSLLADSYDCIGFVNLVY